VSWLLGVAVLTASIPAHKDASLQPPLFDTSQSDPSKGWLINMSPDMEWGSPIDPSRPTVVLVAGLNPDADLMTNLLAEPYSEAIGHHTPHVNVLKWAWGAASFPSLKQSVQAHNAIAQGRMLAAALQEAGIPPRKVHLIGQSIGCLLIASAAQSLCCSTGEAVGQLTFLDALWWNHHLIFEELKAHQATSRIVNYWTDGPSGYGKPARYPGVQNCYVEWGPSPLLGVVLYWRGNHVWVSRWYVRRIANPECFYGFDAPPDFFDP
jgi:pimeloyl-ACP methyl ester carboxylesterase